MYKPTLPDNIDSLKWVGPDDAAYSDSGLIHCTYMPEEATQANPAPVVVMVHGWGGDESVMWLFKQTLPPGIAAITPRAPLSLNSKGFIWFEETDLTPAPDSLEAAVNTLEHFLDSLPRLYPIDPTRLVLIGFSQGAFMCNAFVVSHPDKMLGVASLVGAMPPIPEDVGHSSLLAGVPVFVAHGTRDDTIPVRAAQQTRDAYAELGADVTYGEYPMAHKMNSQAMKDLKAWLAKLFSTR